MATLTENIERGNDAIRAARPDPMDASTTAMDVIVHVMHAGYSNALREAAEGIVDGQVDEGGNAFVHPDVTSPEDFWDTIVERARIHFLAEQAGDGS